MFLMMAGGHTLCCQVDTLFLLSQNTGEFVCVLLAGMMFLNLLLSVRKYSSSSVQCEGSLNSLDLQFCCCRPVFNTVQITVPIYNQTLFCESMSVSLIELLCHECILLRLFVQFLYLLYV